VTVAHFCWHQKAYMIVAWYIVSLFASGLANGLFNSDADLTRGICDCCSFLLVPDTYTISA
jgi:hypothetical protein